MVIHRTAGMLDGARMTPPRPVRCRSAASRKRLRSRSTSRFARRTQHCLQAAIAMFCSETSLAHHHYSSSMSAIGFTCIHTSSCRPLAVGTRSANKLCATGQSFRAAVILTGAPAGKGCVYGRRPRPAWNGMHRLFAGCSICAQG